MNRLSLLVSVAFLLATGCRRPGEAAEAPEPGASAVEGHKDEKAHEALPRVVKLTPQVLSAAGLQVAKVERRALSRTVELTGQVVADPDFIAMLGARVGGRVVKVLVREGDTVRGGQLVALVSSPELGRQRAALAAAQAKVSAARKNAARLRSLVEARLGAEQDAVAAEAEAVQAEAERDAVAESIRGMGAGATGEGDPSLVKLTAPIAGQVIQRDAAPGQVVSPDHTLLTIADLSKAFFQAQLFEKDLSLVREEAPAEVRLNGYPDDVFEGKVVRVSAQVDPTSHNLGARIALTSRDPRVRLGLFGTARISLPDAGGEPVFVIPLSAVTDVGGRKVAFVRHPDGDFELHELTLGDTAGGSVAVLAGLDEGEEVVTRGVHTLKSVVLKSTMADED